MRRWTANFLLLVMLAPGLASYALAATAGSNAMHCARTRQSTAVAHQAMPCHHGMGQMSTPESSEASLRAIDCCCENHACCRGVKTSEWPRPSSTQFSFVSLLIEPAPPAPAIVPGSADIVAPDSARAPPRA